MRVGEPNEIKEVTHARDLNDIIVTARVLAFLVGGCHARVHLEKRAVK